MHSLAAVVLLTSLTSVRSAPYSAITRQWAFNEIPPSTQLEWHPCEERFECAVLDVPLDYANPKGARAYVPIIKLPAVKDLTLGPYQGMLLHNPGGPGGSGVDYLMYLAGELSWKLNYDLVSFDPRGMHHSFPSANCGSQALKARGRLPGSNYPTSFWKVANADVSSLGAACSAQIGGPNDAGPHMSTAVNAKDMLSIVDAFSKTRDGRSSPEPHLLNFWGISYGTFLGQTFASMFPARVRRMVLDANTYPDDFLYGSGANDLVDRDQILASFFDYCSQAGAKKCAFATGNSSTDVRTRFYRSIDGLNAVKAEEEAWANATSITKALIATKRTVWRSVYRPIDGFPRLAEYLSKLERALDINALDQFLAKLTSDLLFAQLTALDPTFEYFAGTICSDSNGFWLNRTFEDLLPGIEKATNTSFLGDEWANFKLYCTKWNIRPKDAFTGPFGASTKTPILFVTTTLDPATPYRNAIRSSQLYPGSQILTINAVGHGAIDAENHCGLQKIRQYLQMGTLSGDATFCPLEKGPFGVVLAGGLPSPAEW